MPIRRLQVVDRISTNGHAIVTDGALAWAAMLVGALWLAGGSAVGVAQEATGTAAPPTVDWLKLGIQFAAGLALFLHGVTVLSDNLRQAAGDHVRRGLRVAASNRVAGVVSGTAATFLLDSSSVTIIILIAIVNAGLLGFAQALPVILGSNIGTTLSSQIYALQVDDYAPAALLVGLLLAFVPRGEGWRQAGMIVFALGLIFFGLHTIGDSVAPLESSPG